MRRVGQSKEEERKEKERWRRRKKKLRKEGGKGERKGICGHFKLVPNTKAESESSLKS